MKPSVSLTTLKSNVPMVLSLDNGDTITNPYDIANTFHNYITKKTHACFSDYLSTESGGTIFPQPTDKKEIASIISSLNSNKASSPNSIP